MNPDYRLPFKPEFLKRLKEQGEEEVSLVLQTTPSFFGYQDGIYYFQPPLGTEIVACRSGRVVEIDRTPLRKLLGLTHRELHNARFVFINHGDETYMNYVHLDSRLKKGDRVEQGETIGRLISGSSDYLPHLHLHHHKFFSPKQVSRDTFNSNVVFTDPLFRRFRYIGGLLRNPSLTLID
ncbi:MAG: M23 family metallopeptidase [Nanoarchaeota archaeon]